MRVYADHGDGADKRLLAHHIQQEQVLPAAGGGTSKTKGGVVSADEVEAIMEADCENVASPDLGGGGRPTVDAGDVAHERCHRADDAASLIGTVAWRVRTRLLVAVLVKVG